MQIEKVPINSINPAPYNPRVDLKPGDPDYEDLKNSIKTFGFVEPLVWNRRTKTLISGHQRLKVLIEQGVKEVEVSVVDLPLEKEKALNLALNKIEGDWDINKLAAILEGLQAIPDFDVGITGFDIPEISEILDRAQEIKEDDGFDFEAAVSAIKEPVTKNGDLIKLGRHRLFCGDSSSLEDFRCLMAGNKAQMLFTDPPFNVRYQNKRPAKSLKRRRHPKWEKIYKDDLPQEEYEAWLEKVISNVDKYLISGSPIYIFNGHRQFGPMYLMLIKLGYRIGSVIVWAKERFAISYADYNQQVEFCLYAWKPGEGGHFWYGPNNETTLWESKRDAAKTLVHPTQKPIALAQRAIKNSSKRGDIVVDTFLGSGSSLIAAQSLKRRCFGLEIDPCYCDAIVMRYIAYVGKDNTPKELLKKYDKR
jgi:DNA modification methylase